MPYSRVAHPELSPDLQPPSIPHYIYISVVAVASVRIARVVVGLWDPGGIGWDLHECGSGQYTWVGPMAIGVMVSGSPTEGAGEVVLWTAVRTDGLRGNRFTRSGLCLAAHQSFSTAE